MTYCSNIDDLVWKAVSDGRRRKILDTLMDGPKTTGQLVNLFSNIGRTGVLKHISVLKSAHLITVKRDGRTRWNFINHEPVEAVCGLWIARHTQGITSSFAQLQTLAEQKNGD